MSSIFDEPMEGPCPHRASTEYEPYCTLANSICYGGSSCETRRAASCPFSDGCLCEVYDGCPCRECDEKGQCLEKGCGELCMCRPDEDTDFYGKKTRLITGEIVES